MFDDFLAMNVFTQGTTTEVATGESIYSVSADTGGTIALLDTEDGGVCRLTIDATGDNEETWLGSKNVLGTIETSGTKVWWEARIRMAQITAQNFFIGLSEEGNTAADAVFLDADTIVDDDHVAFRILAADPDGLDAIHNDNTNEVVVQEAAQVIVADTWYKVGCHFDGTKVYWYVDGVQKGEGVLPAADDFPTGEELGLLIGGKAGGATLHTFDIDWWGFAQLFT
jgi:hypothetical protein